MKIRGKKCKVKGWRSGWHGSPRTRVDAYEGPKGDSLATLEDTRASPYLRREIRKHSERRDTLMRCRRDVCDFAACDRALRLSPSHEPAGESTHTLVTLHLTRAGRYSSLLSPCRSKELQRRGYSAIRLKAAGFLAKSHGCWCTHRGHYARRINNTTRSCCAPENEHLYMEAA